MQPNPDEIHHRFIEIAGGLSPDLVQAFQKTGPVQFQPDDSLPLAHRLCRSVAGQQLSVIAARTIWQRVLEAASGTDLVAFFTEENAEIMRNCGLSNAKVRAMCGIAKEARAGNMEADDLRILSHKERSKELTRLWGVGQWTVDMISIFYFGDEDVWPDGDLAVRKTLEHLTSKRRKTILTAERFAPHRSRLALYMWEYKNAVPDLS
ncbi:MAG: DNA-3-methyladenine glycosylase 2 family protein [Balneolaceae bacterium]|nr:DNA-3-methyladenine glycosylase 2 family protein [Balneolaceae bacterium]